MQKTTGGFTMLNRRAFIQRTFIVGAGAALAPNLVLGNSTNRLTILHTNDLHCRFEPFPSTDPRFPNKGGMNRVSAYVKDFRSKNPNTLLLDSGDFSQGTPFYNFFKANLVLKMMSEMGYDASTIGNHEFDNGMESLAQALPEATFPLICSNYDFSKTILKGKIRENLIIERGGIRIGIYGLGIQPEGLVDPKNMENLVYLDPLTTALKQEEYLKHGQDCDFVICLSHLGYEYRDEKISDLNLAPQTRSTDLILGGHTHSFFEAPVELKNSANKPVVINQVGWGALMLGQLDFVFENKSKKRIRSGKNLNV